MEFKGSLNTSSQTLLASSNDRSPNIQQSLQQLQSLPAFKSSSPLIKNLLQLIQSLISQIGIGNKEPQQSKSPISNQENLFSKQKTPEKAPQERAPRENESSAEMLARQSEFFQNVNKEPRSHPEKNSLIHGTESDETLNGTRYADFVYAKSGDDRVYGRQGNDSLSGQEGNDTLYGGQGNDRLYGGEGNDYLSGGSGKNNLFGGAGDDTLYHRRGSDVFDGGSGNDTARIRASIEDYSVTVITASDPVTGPVSSFNENPAIGQIDDSKILLTNKKTGQTIEAVNVENFKFDDASLSLDEMKQRAGSITAPQKELSISNDQRQGINKQLDLDPSFSSLRVLDTNGDKKLGVGDRVEYFAGDDPLPGAVPSVHILTEEDIRAINTDPKPSNTKELELSPSQIKGVEERFGFDISFDSFRVVDSNGDKKLSVGDKLESFGDDPLPGTLPNVHILTAEDVEAINKVSSREVGEEKLTLSSNEREGVFNLFGLSVAQGSIDAEVRVVDKDSSGAISVGDTAVLSTGGHESPVSETIKELTAADVETINSVEGNKPHLVFSESDEKIINKHVLPSHRPSTSYHSAFEYSVSIKDNDSSGKVSAGDTLTLYSENKGTEGAVISEPVTLTSDQAKGINKDLDERKELVENKAKWENSGVKDYIISGHYEPGGDFGRPGVTGLPVEKEPDIIVRDGEVKTPRVGSFTVDDIFKALENNTFSSASYNEQYGYPESAFIPSSDEISAPSINVSLLSEYRGEPTGARGYGDNHGPSYRIDELFQIGGLRGSYK